MRMGALLTLGSDLPVLAMRAAASLLIGRGIVRVGGLGCGFLKLVCGS